MAETIDDFIGTIDVLDRNGHDNVMIYFMPKYWEKTHRLLRLVHKYVVQYYARSNMLVPYRDMSRSVGSSMANLRSEVGIKCTMLELVQLAIYRGYPLQIINRDGKRNLMATQAISAANMLAFGPANQAASAVGYKFDENEFWMGRSPGFPVKNLVSKNFENRLKEEFKAATELDLSMKGADEAVSIPNKLY